METLARWFRLLFGGPRERKLGCCGCALEGHVGILGLGLFPALSLLPGSHEVRLRPLPHAPTTMYGAATGPKQQGQVAVD